MFLNGLFQFFTLFSIVFTYNVHVDHDESVEGHQRYFLAGPRDYNYNRDPSTENRRLLSDKSLLHKAFFANPTELAMESSPSISDSFYVHPPQNGDASSIGTMTIPVIPPKEEKDHRRKFYNHISRPSKAKDFFSRYNKRGSSTSSTTESSSVKSDEGESHFVSMGSSEEEASKEKIETALIPSIEVEKKEKEKEVFVYEGSEKIKDIFKDKLKENSTAEKLSGFINGREIGNKGTSLVIKIPYKNMKESVEIFDQKTDDYSQTNVFQLPFAPKNSPNLKIDEKGENSKKDEAAIIEILTGPENLHVDPESDPKFWEALYREYLLEQQKISASMKKPQRVGSLGSGKGPMRVKIHIFKAEGEDEKMDGDAVQSKNTELRVKTTTTTKAPAKFERRPSKRVFTPVIPSPKQIETSRESNEEGQSDERFMQTKSNEPRPYYDYHNHDQNQNYEDYQRGSGW